MIKDGTFNNIVGPIKGRAIANCKCDNEFTGNMRRTLCCTFLLFVAIVCLASSLAQSYGGGQEHYSIGKFLGAQRLKKSGEDVVKKSSGGGGGGGDQHNSAPVYVSRQDGLKDADRIDALPGQPSGVNFNQYSGYVTVDPNAGRALFYYLAESQNSHTDPLVLWLNGGPGCSSFGNGAMKELGSFRVDKDGATLLRNEYAWNTLANVLFLESPAGVGFSYSNTTSDYNVGDTRTAADAYTFLVNWLERFPEYKTRDFYLTGESYAGHYVPQLANLIVLNNKKTNQTLINLKGIAIGNAYIDYETEYTGMYDYLWTHAIISDQIHDGIVSNCNFTSSGSTTTEDCVEYTDQADTLDNTIDPYGIYAPLCSSSTPPPKISEYDPCASEYVSNYLNIPAVQKSLHVNVTGSLPGHWESCNNFIFNNWEDQPDSMLPVITQLMANGIRVWLYSGDTDSVVPVTTTRYSINKLKMAVRTPWYPWRSRQGEVGGFAETYDNLTLVTVRGAGHFVPSYEPVRALDLFSAFLGGKPPSTV